MSYILDALRRADAERQRGSVPGLHAQPAPTAAAPGAARRASVPLVWVLAGGGLLLAIALLLWWTGRERAPAAPAVQPAQVVLVTPATMPGSAAQGLPIAPPATPATAPPAARPSAGSTAPTPDASAPAVPAPVSGPARSAPAVAPPPGLPPARSAASAAPQPGPVASAAARVPLLAELPEALRRQLPALALGGSMYSEQAERRLVIVNGQVAHEGDEPAAGLTVRRIGPRSVVFEFHGQAFEIGL